MDIVLEDYFNTICCDETLPLNRIEYTTGNAPTIEDLETILGFTLLNPVKTDDVITFDNVGYHIPDYVFAGDTNIISYDVASGVTAGTLSFAECFSLTTGFNNLTIAGYGCFQGCPSLTSGFNSLQIAGNRTFEACPSLTIGFNSLQTAGESCFADCTSLTSGFNSLQIAGYACFANCTSLTGGFDSLISAGEYCFRNCTSLSNLNFDNVDNYGTNTSGDGVFLDITGNTITVTAKTIHQTSFGGSLEGDLQDLTDNNTVTFIWV